MAAFVGYLVQANGIYFPGNLAMPLVPSYAFEKQPLVTFADISAAGGPADQWDAMPTAAKVQILLFVGFLEVSHLPQSMAHSMPHRSTHLHMGTLFHYCFTATSCLLLLAAVGRVCHCF